MAPSSWVGCSRWWTEKDDQSVCSSSLAEQDPLRTRRPPIHQTPAAGPNSSAPGPSRTSRALSISEIVGLTSAPPSKAEKASAWFDDIVRSAQHYALETPAGTAVTSAILTASSLLIYWRYFRRLKNAEYITPRELALRRTITGRVTQIGDADGFRLYHQPGPPILRSLLHRPPTSPKALRDQTLSIRLAGADAPELAHFGKSEQPFAKEARAELERLVRDRTVRCEVAHIDQYKRLVATPYVWQPPYIFGRTNVSLALIKAGLATVYRQGGASYGSASFLWKFLFNAQSGLSRLERAERVAKRNKRGIWSLGKKLESPEEYKKRTKGGA